MSKTALYYPNIDFTDEELIKTMALYYEAIFRIVPDGVIPNDPIGLQPLLENDHIGRMINPIKYAPNASEKFLDNLDNWDATALIPSDEMGEEIASIHTDKIDEKINRYFSEAGFKENDGWFDVPTILASNYMLFLADEIAKSNNLELVTNKWGAWTGTSYFRLDGEIDGVVLPPEEFENFSEDSFGSFGLFGLMMDELVPINISDIPSEDIVQFREKRKDEINALHAAIDELKVELDKVDANEVSKERVEMRIDEFTSAMADFKKSADLIKAKGWIGSFMMGIPAPVYLLNALEYVSGTPLLVTGLGSMTIGGLFNFKSSREKVEELRKNNPASFFVDLQKSFKNYSSAKTRGNMNMHAWRCMEEYVND